MADLLSNYHPGARWVIAGISLIAVINSALIQIIMGSRVLYGMACQGIAPACLSRVHHVTRTPLLATALTTLAVLLLALSFPMVALAKATSFIVMVVFIVVNLSLCVIKRNEARAGPIQAAQDYVTYPFWIPASGLVLSLLFIIGQLILIGIS